MNALISFFLLFTILTRSDFKSSGKDTERGRKMRNRAKEAFHIEEEKAKKAGTGLGMEKEGE